MVYVNNIQTNYTINNLVLKYGTDKNESGYLLVKVIVCNKVEGSINYNFMMHNYICARILYELRAIIENIILFRQNIFIYICKICC